jgi:hypothetical protein
MPYTLNVDLVGDAGALRDRRIWSRRLFPGQTGWTSAATTLPDSADVSHHPYDAMLAHFVGSIRSGEPAHADVADAYPSHEVCLAIDRSAADGGRAVRLPLARKQRRAFFRPRLHTIGWFAAVWAMERYDWRRRYVLIDGRRGIIKPGLVTGRRRGRRLTASAEGFHDTLPAASTRLIGPQRPRSRRVVVADRRPPISRDDWRSRPHVTAPGAVGQLPASRPKSGRG